MRTVGVVTTSRADYGIYRPVLRRLGTVRDLRTRLIVSGAHLVPEYGMSVKDIESDGFEIAERLATLKASDARSPEGVGRAMGGFVTAYAGAFGRSRPDILMVLGDRYEMHAAALAALPFNIPVAHLHGGEITEGAMDDALRHSITKLSHLHFVSVEEYARRLRQMGEEPWRITVSGAPGLDNLRSMIPTRYDELRAKLGLRSDRPPLLATFHPVTLEFERTAWQVEEWLKAIGTVGHPVLFTAPNADTRSHIILEAVRRFAEAHDFAQFIENLGPDAYLSLMACAPAMVGNSSSGIIEAPSFELPVVNVGSRQRGRVSAANVLHVGYSHDEVAAGLRRALSPEFRKTLRGSKNPYGDGQAAERIVEKVAGTVLDEKLLIKRFVDAPEPQGARA